MPITLNSKMLSEGPEIMYSEGFRQVIEDHLEFLREHENTQVIEIDPHVAYRGHGDLVSVLQDYHIKSEMHWIIMRINGYTTPMEYQSDHLVLLVPTEGLIESLLRVHRVNLKLSKKQQAA